MNVTRRYFLKSSGALALYCGFSPARLLADTAAVTKGKTLVVIFLRGGMDGLNFIVPYADPAYAGLRKNLRIAAPGQPDGALDLDGFFALHPRAAALQPLFAEGQARALHAVGYDLNTRSHFEEQDTWETGVIGNTVSSDGWLNRHLLTSTGHGPVRAVSIGDNLPRILRGKAPAFALHGIADLSLPSVAKDDEVAMRAALEHAYCTPLPEHRAAAQDLLSETAHTTIDGIDIIKKAAAAGYQPAATYPKNELARRLSEAARLIKADIGLEVIEIDYGGWDTHQNQGGILGNYGNLVQNLADGLAAFHKDMGERMKDTLLLTISDFGRTAAENGTGGTDHGWANCMLALGAISSKAPQPVISKWPGLAKEQLHQGRDLLHTTDFRDVLGEVVGDHLGNTALKTVLPGHEFKPVGLV
ncbi:MAG: DUF1501 domain-containing protein [Terrimicrobiaceae bacterium]